MTTLFAKYINSRRNKNSSVVHKRNAQAAASAEPSKGQQNLLLLKQGITEAVLIGNGQLKAVPISELWND